MDIILRTLRLPVISTEPVNCEPFKADSTLNPNTGDTDAVTLPLAILNGENDNADSGISNKPLPLPLNIDAVIVDVNIAGPDVSILPLTITSPMIATSGLLFKSPSTILITPAIPK